MQFGLPQQHLVVKPVFLLQNKCAVNRPRQLQHILIELQQRHKHNWMRNLQQWVDIRREREREIQYSAGDTCIHDAIHHLMITKVQMGATTICGLDSAMPVKLNKPRWEWLYRRHGGSLPQTHPNLHTKIQITTQRNPSVFTENKFKSLPYPQKTTAADEHFEEVWVFRSPQMLRFVHTSQGSQHYGGLQLPSSENESSWKLVKSLGIIAYLG